MNCKYCSEPLEDGVTLCPACGKDNAEAVEPAEEAAPEEGTEETASQAETAQEETAEAGAPEGSEPSQEAREEEAPAPEESEEEETGDSEEPSEEETRDEEESSEEEATEESEQKPARKSKKRIVLMVTAVVVLLALTLGLAASIYYGVNGSWLPKENNVQYKDNYTVQTDQLKAAADKTVASIGEQKLTNGLLNIYYWTQVYDFLGTDYAFYLVDYTQPLEYQITGDGMTYQQYFLDVALDTWHRYQALALQAEAEGVELDPAMQTVLEELPQNLEEQAASFGFSSVQELLDAYLFPGCSLDDYLAYMELSYRAYHYLNTLYEALAPTYEEVDAYFTENEDTYASQGITKETGNIVDVRHILIMPQGGTTDDTGSTTYSEEEWEACRQEAQALYDQWLAGEATEESFAQLAVEHSADGSASNGGLITDITEGRMVPAFNDWCFDPAREYGDHGLVRSEYGYHIMFFVGGQEIWYRYAESDIITDAINKVVEDAIAAFPMKVKYRDIVLSYVNLAGE